MKSVQSVNDRINSVLSSLGAVDNVGINTPLSFLGGREANVRVEIKKIAIKLLQAEEPGSKITDADARRALEQAAGGRITTISKVRTIMETAKNAVNNNLFNSMRIESLNGARLTPFVQEFKRRGIVNPRRILSGKRKGADAAAKKIGGEF